MHRATLLGNSSRTTAVVRFCIERNLLTDDSGKITPPGDPQRLSYSMIDAVDVATALMTIASDDGTELIHPIYHMAPIQAMTTVRRGPVVMTLHAFPEEEAQERLSGAVLSQRRSRHEP